MDDELSTGEDLAEGQVADEDVTLLVHDVWSSIVGVEVRGVDAPTVATVERSMTGLVHIQGDWKGTVTVQVSESLAYAAAAAMFALELDELGREEVDDALGEVANMIGGSIKGLMPGSCLLSLPTVVGGLDYEVNVPGAWPTTKLWFEDEVGRPLVVTVLKVGPNPPDGHGGGHGAGENAELVA